MVDAADSKSAVRKDVLVRFKSWAQSSDICQGFFCNGNFVYILYAAEFDKFYIGQTADVDQRLLRHNSGSEKATLPYRT